MGGASSGAMTMETISGECRPAPPLGPEERRSLLDGDCHDPHAVLGAHPAGQGVVIRALRPFADTVTVLTRDGGRWELWPEGDGLFAGLVPIPPGTEYRYELQYAEETAVADDPYRYQPTLGELDLHLIGEGRHERLWEVLGSRVRRFGEADESAGKSGKSKDSGNGTGAKPVLGSGSGSGSASNAVSGSATPAASTAATTSTAGATTPAKSDGSSTPTSTSAADDAADRAAAQARLAEAFGPVTGVSFAVWAPNARGVRVIGDFNYWNGAAFPLRSLGSSGVWELFVPQTGPGERYKYEILGRDGIWRQKADPLARRTEPPPGNASVTDDSDFVWTDQDWLAKRAETDPYRAPMSVYELHLQSWRPGLDYRQLADELPAYLLELGFTHVEFLPPTEHPFGGSWGYQVSSYFAPTARLGKPDDFRALIDALHAAGIGVFIDWVPAHFPKDAWALADFDGTALYEHSDPRRGEHPDWGTLVFDYGRREVRNFLVASALFWCEQMHIDGLRVDAVASMLYLDYSREEGQWHPNAFGGRENLEAVSFLQELTATCYKRAPGVIVVAEESTAWPGVTLPTDHHVYGSALTGLGFGFKWNMGWMHDTLGYLAEDPINRRYHHDKMTFALVYAYTEKFVLAISHDEVVHGKGSLLRKMAGDRWQQMANVRAYLAFMWAHPGKQLLFSGCEFAQDAEWSEQHGLDWWLLDYPEHRGVFRTVQDLNFTYAKQPALWEQDHTPAGFEWLVVDDSDHNVFAFVRWSAEGRPLVCVVNFAAVPWDDYHLPLPLSAEQSPRWTELLNTDAEQYGGSGVGNFGMVSARDQEWSGRPSNAVLRLPPLGTLWLVPERVDELVSEMEAEAAEVIAEAEQVAISAVEEQPDLVVEVLPGPTAEPVGELEAEGAIEVEVEADERSDVESVVEMVVVPLSELDEELDEEPELEEAPTIHLVRDAEAETETVTEAAVDTEAEPEAELETVSDLATEPEVEPALAIAPEPEAETESASTTELAAEPVLTIAPEPEVEPEPETAAELAAATPATLEAEPETEPKLAIVPETKPEVEPASELAATAPVEPELASEPEAEPEIAAEPAVEPALTIAPEPEIEPEPETAAELAAATPVTLEAKPETEPELAIVPEPEPEREPAAKAETPAETAPAASAEPEAEPAPAPEAQPKLAATPKPAPKPAAESAPKPTAEPVASKVEPEAEPAPATPTPPAAATSAPAAAEPTITLAVDKAITPTPKPRTAAIPTPKPSVAPKPTSTPNSTSTAPTPAAPAIPTPPAGTDSPLPSARRDTMMPLFRTPTNRTPPKPTSPPAAALPPQVAPAATKPFLAPKPKPPASASAATPASPAPAPAPRTAADDATTRRPSASAPAGPAPAPATFSAAPPAPTPPASSAVRPKPGPPPAQQPPRRS